MGGGWAHRPIDNAYLCHDVGDYAVDQRGYELRVFLEALGDEGQCERTFFLLLGNTTREDMKGIGKEQG